MGYVPASVVCAEFFLHPNMPPRCSSSDSEPVIKCDQKAEMGYLSLEELGKVLKGLSEMLQGK